MLYGYGIVARLERRHGVVAGARRARHMLGVSLDVGYRDLRAGNSCSRRVKNNAGDTSRSDLRRNVLRAEPTYQQAKPEQNVDAVSASDHSFTTRSGRDLGPIERKRC